MGFLDFILGQRPYPPEMGGEVKELTNELIKIGQKEDYLSEFPGPGYNIQCRHVRARAIGTRLDEIGGNDLLRWAYRQVRKQAGETPASHLEYAWQGVGHWEP